MQINHTDLPVDVYTTPLEPDLFIGPSIAEMLGGTKIIGPTPKSGRAKTRKGVVHQHNPAGSKLAKRARAGRCGIR